MAKRQQLLALDDMLRYTNVKKRDIHIIQDYQDDNIHVIIVLDLAKRYKGYIIIWVQDYIMFKAARRYVSQSDATNEAKRLITQANQKITT